MEEPAGDLPAATAQQPPQLTAVRRQRDYALRGCLGEALLIVADDLHDRMYHSLERSFETAEWWKEIPAKHGDFARRDVASWADCLLGEQRHLRDARPHFREALGMPAFRRSHRQLSVAAQVRNRWAHPDALIDAQQAKDEIGQLLAFAGAAGLGCQARLAEVLQRVAQLQSGRPVQSTTQAEVDQLTAAVDRLQAELAIKDQALTAVEEKHEATHDRLAEVEAERDEAQKAESARAAREADLRRQLEQRDLEQADVLALQARLAASQHEEELLDAQLATLTAQQKELEHAVKLVVDRVAEERSRAEMLEQERDALRGALAIARVESQGSQHAAQIVSLAGALAGEDQTESAEAVTPGSPWPYPRGDEIWVLSAARRRLVRNADDLDLADVIGAEAAARVTDTFLRIRPTGGRVWVDDDGDAATFVSGQLCYLGSLYVEEDDAGTDPPIGTPAQPAGRRFSVSIAGIYDTAMRSLSSVVGSARARIVRDRLLQVRPEGGRFRVDESGAAVTYLDGHWVFAGRIAVNEWFPGYITKSG